MSHLILTTKRLMFFKTRGHGQFEAIAQPGEGPVDVIMRIVNNITWIICTKPEGVAICEWESSLRHAIYLPNHTRTLKV